jgi:hypothetical protein
MNAHDFLQFNSDTEIGSLWLYIVEKS